jgi:regulator of sirC expression with transglutaminase-like and TPR domain
VVPGALADPAVRFREIVSRPEEQIDLAEGALLIAQGAYPDLDVTACLGRIEELAQRLSTQVPEDSSETQRILALNRFLFEQEGFAPNIEDYYDPRNSFLNEVLERRVGIPITLSIVYIEVGRRIGLVLEGVSFPGHFLVKCKLRDGTAILDPYCGGVSLSLNDLQQRLREVRGGEVSRAIVAGLLVSANKKEILARVLRNLKAIYLQREEFTRALATIDWICAINPQDAGEVRDRGMTYLKLECFRAALADLERYLELAPGADDVEDIRGQVIELRRTTARLN